MDLWVFAAAAGAGYTAKNWQNFAAEEQGLREPPSKVTVRVLSESWNLLQQVRDKTCPFRRLARQKEQGDVISEKHNDLGVNLLEMDRSNYWDSVTKAPSRRNPFENIDGRVDHSGFWFSKLPPVYNVGASYVDNSGCDYAESCNFHRFSKNKLITRCRPSSVRPLNSLESCRQQRIRNLSSGLLAVEVECGKEESQENCACLEEHDAVSIASSFEQNEKIELQRKPETYGAVSRLSASSDRVSSISFQSNGHDGMLLFLVGMTLGIMPAVMARKNEVEKLNKKLKKTQSLVQDLHEELDMKEILTVKEPSNDGYRPPGTEDQSLSIQEPVASRPEIEVNEPIPYDSLNAHDKNSETSELRNKIEAELKAELERLEHDMMTSKLERTYSAFDFNSDWEPYTEQGDLKFSVASESNNYRSESQRDETETTPDFSQPANYAVSPQELSLRLHELIESRLEAHIKELEMALENSEKYVQALGPQSVVSKSIISYSDTESSSSPLSPASLHEHNTTNGHMKMNLSSSSSGCIQRVQ